MAKVKADSFLKLWHGEKDGEFWSPLCLLYPRQCWYKLN